MSDSTPIPAPTAAQINAYPGKLALSGNPAPEIVENLGYALNVTQVLLSQAVGLLDQLRDVKNPEDTAFVKRQVDRFFAKFTRFDRGTTEDPA